MRIGVWSVVRPLGQLESVVMGRLWSYRSPVAVREVLEDLRQDRTIAYTTVMTVMDNLHRKGFLAREMVGRAYHYVPAQTLEQHNAAVMGEALAASSDRTATLLRFLEQMAAEDVIRLQEALASRAPTHKARNR
ncbi:MAG: BlaI/MecI/CopY family transcriptional regulator [Nocardioidaceae bacterium]|nr:BlaI/MecI/CopY family transcriptional regulator [Nocardioidaceae bacterium]